MIHVLEVFKKVTQPTVTDEGLDMTVTDEGLDMLEDILKDNQKINLLLFAKPSNFFDFLDALSHTEGDRAHDLYVKTLAVGLPRLIVSGDRSKLFIKKIDELTENETRFVLKVEDVSKSQDILNCFASFGQAEWVKKKLDQYFPDISVHEVSTALLNQLLDREQSVWFIKKLDRMTDDEAFTFASDFAFELIEYGNCAEWFIEYIDKCTDDKAAIALSKVAQYLVKTGFEEYVMNKLSGLSDEQVSQVLNGQTSIELGYKGKIEWVMSKIDQLPNNHVAEILSDYNFIYSITEKFFKLDWLKDTFCRLSEEQVAKIADIAGPKYNLVRSHGVATAAAPAIHGPQ